MRRLCAILRDMNKYNQRLKSQADKRRRALLGKLPKAGTMTKLAKLEGISRARLYQLIGKPQ